MSSVRINILLVTLLSVTIGQSQHFLHTDGRAIVNELQDTILLRGMGLGGWMIQEGYMLQTSSFANAQHQIKSTIQELIGEEATDLFYNAWLENHVQRADIDSLKSWGFNSVRLPMHYNLFTLPIEEEPIDGQNTWLDKGFALTDSLISWCEENEMYVILDLHAAPGGQGYDEGISDYDPSKPSLWESESNRNKMASLWKQLAQRYAEEQWVAGYDLLNEPNWNLPGGTALRNLYLQVTDSIRSVDPDHMLFIEGNWFANDFTGLTPPWDDNMVYSPHKYWSNNDESVMQFALSLRDSYNVPLYLGESGENSNVWFRDAIRLMEDLDIGWAWWPMKKIEAIAGPLSIVKTPEYQYLLNYWNGTASEPDSQYAIDALMDLTEGLKIENCIYQKDVIDAMFRQVYSDDNTPFKQIQQIPGVIYSSDYDMGVLGEAYFDIQAATYHVSTGNYTSWNNGWSYRNDGVDIEPCDDIINTNGYNVGWIDTGEWMKYTVQVNEPGVYEVQLRFAAGSSNGKLHFESNGTDITQSIPIPSSGGWDEWESLIIEDVILESGVQELTVYADQEGFNLSSMEFVATGNSTSSVNTTFISSRTFDEQHIELTLNKTIESPLTSTLDDFEIVVNGSAVPVTEVQVEAQNSKNLVFELDYQLNSLEIIKITYDGDQILATDGSPLEQFTLEDVDNTLKFVHKIPGIIEAEEYCSQSGVELENTTDIGGGQNIGYLDVGDYLDYEIDIQESGTYSINFRTASEWGNGGIELLLIDMMDSSSVIGQFDFFPTGGWQTWVTSTDSVELEAGRYSLRVSITGSPFNLNWFSFQYEEVVDTLFQAPLETVVVYPNPGENEVSVAFSLYLRQDLRLSIYDANGREIVYKELLDVFQINEVIDLEGFKVGLYHVVIHSENDERHLGRFIKVSY